MTGLELVGGMVALVLCLLAVDVLVTLRAAR